MKNEEKFLEQVKEYFGVDAGYIKAVLKELSVNDDIEKLVLTEQFNKGFVEGMKESTSNIEKYLSQYLGTPIEDFKEIDPESNTVTTIEDIVVTDKVTDGDQNK